MGILKVLPKLLNRDHRFTLLTIKLQSRRCAIGAFVEALELAEAHCNNKETAGLIPLDEWEQQGMCKAIIEVGLAEVHPNGIYVKGTDEAFDAIRVMKMAGSRGGKKSAEARIKKYGTAQPSKNSHPPTVKE